jgi:NitT/TauT family transport system substrate-binding protein
MGTGRGRAGFRRRVATALVTAASVVVGTAACLGPPSTPSHPKVPDKVTVELIPIVDVAPIYLGLKKGFFSEQNIDLTVDTAAGGANIIPAVAAGQYEFGFSNSPSVLIAQTNGVPIKAIAPGDSTTGRPGSDFSGLVVKDPSITSPRQLAGKKVAANTLKGIVELSIRELVAKAGADAASVNVVPINFPDMVAALDSNQVDAIFAVEPALSAAKAKGWHVLGDFATIDPKMTVALYFTSAHLAVSNPDLVARFTAATAKSLDYASLHPDEVRDIVGTYTTVAADVRAKMVLPGWPMTADSSTLSVLADLIVKYNAADRRPDLSEVLR